MKVKNIGSSRLYLSDLKLFPQSQTDGRRGEDFYLHPGDSIYLPDTSEVLRSVHAGTLRKWADLGTISLNDLITLAATPGPNDSTVINHNLRYPPGIVVLKQVGSTYVDATGAIDIVHNSLFTTTTLTNPTDFSITFLLRIG